MQHVRGTHERSGSEKLRCEKVKSSAKSGETTIISENELDISMLKKEIQEIGYELKDWHSEPYEEKGLFSFGK